MELTKKQITQQDFIDNSIFELLTEINPSLSELEWDIETIAEIRDLIQWIFVEKYNLCSAQEFYPFLEK